MGKPFATMLFIALSALSALAQSEEPKIVVDLDGFRYPPIAKQAHIGGDVVLRLSGQEVVSVGNPLLAPAARDNVRTWTLPPLRTGRYKVTYHFEILDPPRQHSVPIGNGFGRFFRRLVGAPTKTVVFYRCEETPTPPDPAPRFTVSTGSDVAIDVFGDGYSPCRMTQVSDF